MTLDARPDRDLGAEAIAAAGALSSGAVLLAGASVGRYGLAVAVALVQVVLLTAWWWVARPSSPGTTLLVGGGAAVAADLLLLPTGGDPLGRVVGVLGLSVIAAMLLELVRPRREHVAVALAAAVTAAAAVVLLAGWIGQVTGATAANADQARGLVQVAVVAAAAGGAGRLVVAALLPDAGVLRSLGALSGGVLAAVLLGALVGTFAQGDPDLLDVVTTAGVGGVGVLAAGLVAPHRGGWGSVALAAVLPVTAAAPGCLLVARLLLD